VILIVGRSNMNEKSIRNRLVEKGEELFNKPRSRFQPTGVPEADALQNDLDNHPHAFVLACVMDRQDKTEKASLIPYRLSEKLGGFSMQQLAPLSEAEVKRLMTQPKPLHRYADKMSRFLYLAVQWIAKRYGGDAASIWAGTPPSAEVVYRFLEFDGVGPKIANMAANILVRDLKVLLADRSSIDISADVHVRRVFARLGLCTAGPPKEVERVIYKARALHPEYPGMMDLPSWEIGRKWCKAPGPECSACYMNDLCPNASENK
jgi:endonuclease III